MMMNAFILIILSLPIVASSRKIYVYEERNENEIGNQNVAIEMKTINAKKDQVTNINIRSTNEEKEDLSCPICYQVPAFSEAYRTSTCKHFFCKVCLWTWLKSNPRCPYCRTDCAADLANLNHMHRSNLSKFCHSWLCSWKIWNIYYHLFQLFVMGIYLHPLLFSPLPFYYYFWSGITLFGFAMVRVGASTNHPTLLPAFGIFILKSITFLLMVMSLPNLKNDVYDPASFLARFVYEVFSAIVSLIILKQ